MPAQILRIEGRSEHVGTGGEHLHVLGLIRPPNALAREGLPAVEVLVEDAKAARKSWDEAFANRKSKRGRPPKPSVSFLIAGPPPLDGPDAWDVELVRRWARDSIAWLQRTCPQMRISVAAVHWDERSPHVHVLAAPIAVRPDGSEVLGINGLIAQIARTAPPDPEGREAKGKHRDNMSRSQDAYHAEVGRHYGLKRGRKLPAKPRKHVKVDPIVGVQRRVDDIKAKAEADRRVAANEAERLMAKAREEEANIEAARRELHEAQASAEARLKEFEERRLAARIATQAFEADARTIRASINQFVREKMNELGKP